MQSENIFIENLLLDAWRMSSESIINNETTNVRFFEFLGEWPTIRKYDLKENGIVDVEIKDNNIVNTFFRTLKYISHKVKKNSLANIEIIIKKYKENCLQLYFYTDGWSLNSYNDIKKLKIFMDSRNAVLYVIVPSSVKYLNDNQNLLNEIISSTNNNNISNNQNKSDTFYRLIIDNNGIRWWSSNENEKILRNIKHTNNTVYPKDSTVDNNKTLNNSQPFNKAIRKDAFLPFPNKISHKIITNIGNKNVQPNISLNKTFPNPRKLSIPRGQKIDIKNQKNKLLNTIQNNGTKCMIDIVFLVDLSPKTKSYLGDYLHSILVILSKAVISRTKIQVSVVTFSSHSNQSVLFNFGKQNTLFSISEKLNYLVNVDDDDDDSNPNIIDTIAFLYKFFKNTTIVNLRPGAHKKVVVLTQGYFNQKQYIPGEMKKLKKYNLEMYCMGIKKKNTTLWKPKKEELLLIAQNQKNVGIFSSYPNRIFVRRIIPAVCKF
uniref:VWFA domain-containing protein n=1 Tax=Strongyloides venezuelensis TaxID=75913 RepID=A0A0K0FFA2_STRVS